MLISVERLVVEQAKHAEFFSDLRRVARAAVKAPGCRCFDIENEHGERGAVLVIERWRNKSSQRAFFQAPAFSRFVRTWSPTMESDLLLHGEIDFQAGGMKDLHPGRTSSDHSA